LKMSPFDRAHDFLLTFHSNQWPISYRFQDRRQFQSKIANPCILRPCWRELGIGAGGGG